MTEECQRTHTHPPQSLYQQQGQEQLEVPTNCSTNPLLYEIEETEYEELRQCNISENRALIAELGLSGGLNQIIGQQETSFGPKKISWFIPQFLRSISGLLITINIKHQVEQTTSLMPHTSSGMI